MELRRNGELDGRHRERLGPASSQCEQLVKVNPGITVADPGPEAGASPVQPDMAASS
jgi:hypothetical protein